MTQTLPRRRFLTITAAAAGLPLLGLPGAGLARETAHLHRWQGVAMGARAIVLLHHPDAGKAAELMKAVTDEVRRLEAVFTLFHDDSPLSRLNRDGVLTDPPADLVVLLSRGKSLAEITGGAFDMTVQPLWRLYADHFSWPRADPEGPSAEDIEKTRELVDYRAVQVEAGRIAFARPGMAVTLNGIAQGYITDKVADLLRRHGVTNVLVDIGEVRALGRDEDRRPWQVGIADPDAPDRPMDRVSLSDMALATSGGYGSPFEVSGRHHHLLDPKTGRSSNRYRSVSVIAPEATVADGLSTALSSMPLETFSSCLAATGAAKAMAVLPNGRTSWSEPT